jgi:2'-5' RNA ligase
MRLFVAVDLAEAVRAAAADIACSLSRSLAGANVGGDVSWVKPANLHLTLRFIGHVSEQLGGRIGTALQPPFEMPPFRVRLAGAGTFPESRPPRVLWLGVAEGGSSLRGLAAGIESRLGALGLAPEARPFHAHLTLARVRRQDRRIAAAIRRALEGVGLDAGEWLVDHATLYESKLSPKGSTYVPLVRSELAG